MRRKGKNGENIKEPLRTRKYKSQPVRKVEIPKPDGGVISNVRKFLISGIMIDEEYRVQVGGEDFRIDLLFFHRGLQCLLKIGKSKPEYISKMDFYLEALD